MRQLKTLGVYIEEKNAFPNSVVAVSTAVPVFIGYTEKALNNNKSLLRIPTPISSFTEYLNLFGKEFHALFAVEDANTLSSNAFSVNGIAKKIVPVKNNQLLLYNSIRLFYANGGGNCYILAVGTYGSNNTSGAGYSIAKEDFLGNQDHPSVFELLKKEIVPTLIVMPDIALFENVADTYEIYQQALLHCKTVQSRFTICDVIFNPEKTIDEDIAVFRNNIGVTALNYGAAYYPWLHTSIVADTEINFTNLDASVQLENILPEQDAKLIIKNADRKDINKINSAHKSLMALSPLYKKIMQAIKENLNLLPPSGAIAGIYTMIDNSRGVWKAPANVSVATVTSPSVNIAGQLQENLNNDAVSGKSVNVIRPFPGVGTLVWGARTLDGNSLDWRYVNVRRTMIMIEQSIKLATAAYVFELNNANTWITVKSMIENFLTDLWKQGALAGAKPEDAFIVQIGLGSTMTADDILNGIMCISVSIAIVRPAEFIVIAFQQQMQQS
jgi:phage tail sheath protein FI